METSADAGGVPAGQGPALYLPAPTGECPVGTTSLWLADTARRDPWAAGVADSRILAGIDMDGSTAAPIPDEGLARSFLFLGKQSNYTPGAGIIASPDGKHVKDAVITWERDWELLTGWKRWLVVTGAVHAANQCPPCPREGLLQGAVAPGGLRSRVDRPEA